MPPPLSNYELAPTRLFNFCVVNTIKLIKITNRYGNTYKYIQIIKNEDYKLINTSG